MQYNNFMGMRNFFREIYSQKKKKIRSQNSPATHYGSNTIFMVIISCFIIFVCERQCAVWYGSDKKTTRFEQEIACIEKF